MRALCTLLSTALLLVRPVTAAVAADPLSADILGLHLGMTQSTIVAHLLSQGINGLSIQDDHSKCPALLENLCTNRITAPTRDGILLIRFITEPGAVEPIAWTIAYTLTGRLPGEPAIIRSAVLDHFGQPTSGPDPAVWCAHPTGSACVSPDQPQITFQQGPGTASTLTLIDPSAVIHAGP